jgi:hypothetical protein
MLKQPNLVRGLVIRAMYKLRLDLSNISETDAILALGGSNDSHPENMAAAVNVVLVHMGMDPPKVKDPRFDKTHRALAKKRLKGPRGVNTRGGAEPTQDNTHGEP